jgi:uncharacterized protein (DUF849 family)
MLLKAAINGTRSPGVHPALPIGPAALAASAAEAVRGGAGALHLHVRAPDGRESLAVTDMDAALTAVRLVCGRVPVGVSTGAWIIPDVGARLAAVLGWRVRPDFASVNFHEAGAVGVAQALLAQGVGVEAGVASPEAARALVESGIGPDCLRVLFEPTDQDLAGALRTVEAIETGLAGAAPGVPRLLHGSEGTAWPLLRVACQRGYDAHIGLEDTLELPDGRGARDNGELVAVALELTQRGAEPWPTFSTTS